MGAGRTHIWAGGFGWSANEPNHVGIHALIDGVEVGVDTSVPNPRSSADVRRRLSVIDLVHNYVLNGIPRLLPPVSITVLPDDRTIPVAGRDLVFSGKRIDGDSGWIGEVERDGSVIRVSVRTGMPELALEPCRGWRAMSWRAQRGIELSL